MSTKRVRPLETEFAVEPVKACPVEQAIHVIGGKWKLLLLRSLLLNGPQGYNELLASVSGISSKELTRNLRELIGAGLVARGEGAAARTLPYSLTRSGRGLYAASKSLLTLGQEDLVSRSKDARTFRCVDTSIPEPENDRPEGRLRRGFSQPLKGALT